MRKFEEKACATCGIMFQPTGSNHKHCDVCRKQRAKDAIKAWAYKNGILNGTGSGSTTGSGKDNFNYKHGRGTFLRWAKERKETVGLCEHCGKDIREATHYEWVGHHRDHNPMNNVIENLMLLCKRCHQVEHECWKAFEGVTTIPEGSRADNSSKRTPSSNG